MTSSKELEAQMRKMSAAELAEATESSNHPYALKAKAEIARRAEPGWHQSWWGQVIIAIIGGAVGAVMAWLLT